MIEYLSDTNVLLVHASPTPFTWHVRANDNPHLRVENSAEAGSAELVMPGWLPELGGVISVTPGAHRVVVQRRRRTAAAAATLSATRGERVIVLRVPIAGDDWDVVDRVIATRPVSVFVNDVPAHAARQHATYRTPGEYAMSIALRTVLRAGDRVSVALSLSTGDAVHAASTVA